MLALPMVATVMLGIQVIHFNLGYGFGLLLMATNPMQSEASQYISGLNKAQFAYFFENNQFSSSINELELGIGFEGENLIQTRSYTYLMELSDIKDYQQENKTLPSVTISAIPRVPYIKSYFGYVTIGEGSRTKSIICKAKQPYGLNFLPQPPVMSNGVLKCGAGTEKR